MKFKKMVFAISFFYLGSLPLFSQEITLGIQAGLVGSDHLFRSDLEDDFLADFHDPRLSGAINAVVDIPLSPRWSLTFLPGYIQKGARVQDTGTGRYNLKFNYLQLPLHSTIRVHDKLKLSFGPELSFMTSARSQYQGDNINVNDIVDNKILLAGNIALNLQISEVLSAGLIYSRDFTPAYQLTLTDEDGMDLTNQKIYNHYGQLYLRYNLKTLPRS